MNDKFRNIMKKMSFLFYFANMMRFHGKTLFEIQYFIAEIHIADDKHAHIINIIFRFKNYANSSSSCHWPSLS